MGKIKKDLKPDSKSLVFKNKNIMKKREGPLINKDKLKEALKTTNFVNGNSKLNKQENGTKVLDENYKEKFIPVWSQYKARTKVHVPSFQEDWTSELVTERAIFNKLDISIIKRLRILAKQIYDDDVKVHQQSQENNNKNNHFQKTVISHGTSKDKVAAYALRCLESPIYSVRDLLSLIEFVDKKTKSNKFEPISHLKTLFKDTFLPNNHVARKFENHNFKVLVPWIKDAPEKVEKQLVLWHFEDQVRYAYLQLLRKLDEICLDVQPKMKYEAIKSLTAFVMVHPDQDIEIALSILINKLGDNVGGEVTYRVTMLLKNFPHMKPVAVSIIKELLQRPNITPRAQQLGLGCLSNFLLLPQEHKLHEELITIYINFFMDISKKGEVDSRFMKVLLRGLNRLIPYYQGNKIAFLQNKIDALYTMCHLVNFNVCAQTLQLLFNITSKNNEEFLERFYNIVYSKILDPGFGVTASITQFLNLVFIVLAEDKDVARVNAFVRRLLQVAHHMPSNISCAILYLISEVVKDNSCISSLKFLLTKLDTPVPTSLYSDSDNNECGTHLDGEEMDDEDDENCHEISSSKNSSQKSKDSSSISSDNSQVTVKVETLKTNKYDPLNRNAKFCGSRLANSYEIMTMESHFNPSVAMFAKDLVKGNHVEYSGDPLIDFTLKKFLDRFAVRNPKKIKPTKGSVFGRLSYPKGIKKLPIEGHDFKNLNEKNVPVDDLFCYKYMTLYKQNYKSRKLIRDDNSSVDDDEFDDYLERIKQLDYFAGGKKDDEDFEDIDFADGAKHYEDAEEEEDDENDDFDADETNDFGEDDEDEEYNHNEDDFFDCGSGMDDLSFSEDDDFDGDDFEDLKSSKKKSKKPDSDDWDNNADAEEFSQLLESVNDHYDPLVGTSEQTKRSKPYNKKQDEWEQKQTRKQQPNFSKRNKSAKSFKRKK